MERINRPLFSIATPCFNSEKTIERTIKSVLAQGFKDYEYIIVDGGSTDGTLDIVRRYEPLFEGRMRWHSEPDKGIYDAFNKGVKFSTGHYCWNVNSDDWIEPDALLKIAPIAEQHKSEVCILCCRYAKYSGSIKIGDSKLVTQDNIDYCANSLLRMGISHPASVYSREVYNEVGLYDDRYYISGDLNHFIRCYRNGKVLFLPVDVVITNMSDGGVSNTFNLKKVNHDWRITYSTFCDSKWQMWMKMVKKNLLYFRAYMKK